MVSKTDKRIALLTDWMPSYRPISPYHINSDLYLYRSNITKLIWITDLTGNTRKGEYKIEWKPSEIMKHNLVNYDKDDNELLYTYCVAHNLSLQSEFV